MATTASYLQNAGQNYILQSTSTGTAGNWIPVHPSVRNITFQATLTGSSVAVSVSGGVSIQASNDGVNALSSTLGTISFSSQASPASDGFTMDAHYNFIRAYLNSGATYSSGSSASVIASVHTLP